MRRRDDDLSPFRDDPVFRALTAPATSDELVGEAEALAAFRAANASRPMRRFAARIGTSGAVAVVAVTLSAGAAAAYTAELPAPVQRTLHEALGPIGVPAPTHHRHTASGGAQSAATPVAVPSPTASGRSSSAAAGGTPAPHGTSVTVPSSPTSTPVVTPTVPIVVTTPTPTPSPTATLPSLVGASLVITSESVAKIAPGSTATVTGQLASADGTPVAGRQVALFEHVSGEAGWTRLPTTEVTSTTGTVMFTTTALDHDVQLVLRAYGHLRSAAVQVVIVPDIAENTAASPTSATQEIVTVTVTGAEQGDVIGLSWFAGSKHHLQGVLDQTGTAIFTVPIPKHRTVTYRLFVSRTQAHGAATDRFSVAPHGVTPSA